MLFFCREWAKLKVPLKSSTSDTSVIKLIYHAEHTLVLQQSADTGEETDEHHNGADCDQDVCLGVIAMICQQVVRTEDQITHFVIASYPYTHREDRAACQLHIHTDG